jgi:hypothetical protein
MGLYEDAVPYVVSVAYYQWRERAKLEGRAAVAHVGCFVFCVLCFVFCVLCFVFCVLCFVFCVLCFVLCSSGRLATSLVESRYQPKQSVQLLC